MGAKAKSEVENVSLQISILDLSDVPRLLVCCHPLISPGPCSVYYVSSRLPSRMLEKADSVSFRGVMPPLQKMALHSCTYWDHKGDSVGSLKEHMKLGEMQGIGKD